MTCKSDNNQVQYKHVFSKHWSQTGVLSIFAALSKNATVQRELITECRLKSYDEIQL